MILAMLTTTAAIAFGQSGGNILPLCTGTLPDVASGWIRMDGRTVRVHGGCSPRFTRLYDALLAAVTAR